MNVDTDDDDDDDDVQSLRLSVFCVVTNMTLSPQMCPIIGVRYRCKDCEEKIGFDLCENCYNTRSNLSGRFNQQHTSKHQFEKKTSSDSIRNMMLRLVAGHVDDSPTRTVSSDTNASEGTEYGDLSSLNGENRDDLTDPGPPM